MAAKRFGLSVRAAIRDEQGRCLLLQRSAGSRLYAGQWELPGGKADPGEAFDEALVREVAEETGLTISLERAVGLTEADLPSVRVVTLILEARVTAGEVALSHEHEAFAWVPLDELPSVALRDEFRAFAQDYSRSARPAGE